jgi:hypothetical protein
MNEHIDWWGSLNHGGLLIAPDKIISGFTADIAPLTAWQSDKLRRALTAFDGSNERLSALLDFMLQDLAALPEGEWQKAQGVDLRWSLRSFTGALVKPRRLWQGPEGEVLPIFVPEEGASRVFAGRLGVGRSRQLLSRVVEWLRQKQQPLALVTNGRQWRLVHAGQDYEAWCEWDIDLWFIEGQPGPQVLAWLQLLSRNALVAPSARGQGALLTAIMSSRKGQADLSAVLGERVRQAVEELITSSHGAIEQAQQAGNAPAFADLYVAGSRIVMRCIITLFAEARNLLPVDNPVYQRAYSLEGLRQTLDRRASGRGNERLAQGRSAWPRLMALFGLIYQGSSHESLPVPQYSGGLFEPGDWQSPNGISRALALLEGTNNAITDRQVQHMLRLLTRTKLRVRQGRQTKLVDAPVDFSALSSEYIGILYEGLLDFELKQAASDDPVVFLAVGNEPALTLSQLEGMEDAVIKQLFDALKKKDKADSGDDDSGDDAPESDADESQEEVEETDAEDDSAESDSLPEPEPSVEEDELTLDPDHMDRAQVWLEKAAVLAGLVKRPRGRRAASISEDAEAQARAGRQLCARLVAPGQFFLVRWGGTRKGAGTFYTRPQLAGPTVRRTLQPLVYEAVRSELDARTGLMEVVEWIPKRPEVILALKVCDPGMGSGSFLAGALRYLTEALFNSLYHHKLIERADDGGVPRMADGQISELLSDELLKLNPAHEDFEQALRAQLKRHIVERCLYGVDLDPLAVELGRMALWVETMDRDLPFGFLDHKLKVGNSLVGAWFDTYRDYPALAWEREGGDKDYQKDKPGNLINHFYLAANGKKRGDKFTAAINVRAKAVPEQLVTQLTGQMSLGATLDAKDVHDELLAVFRKLHRLPVHESEQRAEMYRDKVLNNPHYHALKARMDLWCALWFWPGEQIEQAPLPISFGQPTQEALEQAQKVARQQRFFHWELEFPDVFTASQPGFDAILGNPPWETMQPNSKEFFSNHDPLYRAYGKQEALGKQLEYFRANPDLEADWIAYVAGFKATANWMNRVGRPFGDGVAIDKDGKKRHELNLGGRGQNCFVESALLHRKWQQQRAKHKGFADTLHPFLHQGSGKPYLQKMFLEVSHALLRSEGRMGMIVPSGIYTDKGTTSLRELFLDHCDWQWLFGFENREKVFDIDSRFKFCPLVVQKGGTTKAIRAAFMHRNVDDWANAERHVLSYPRERVQEFSPYSKAILEIRSEKDLHVLQKIYANGVIVGDKTESGWGIRYQQGDFNMTSDSKLFPTRSKWETEGYLPDEFGHWLKGPWRTYEGPLDILDREKGFVLSRDRTQALWASDIEGVALPLLEGNIIDQFQASSKGWVSGKGRSAVWRDISPEEDVFEPQYLIGLDVAASKVFKTGELAGQPKWVPIPKATLIDVTSATNARTARVACTPYFPCGNTATILHSRESVFALATAMNTFTYDFVSRSRCGGLHLNWFVIEESVLPPKQYAGTLNQIGQSLLGGQRVFAGALECVTPLRSALTRAERLRLRCISEAIVASQLGLSFEDLGFILLNCDHPCNALTDAFTQLLDPKGFWRIDKALDPELRLSVLTMVAFHDLLSMGIDRFIALNDGEGWYVPETLRLSDFGLGHDERAKASQDVASRLGPRFSEMQLIKDAEITRRERTADAELIRSIVPLQTIAEKLGETTESAAEEPAIYKQGGLF